MTKGQQSCLVDTNVVLRFVDSRDPLHGTARRAVGTIRQTHDLRVTSQNLVESWNVMTRPRDRNGFGQSITEANTNLNLIERLFPRLADLPDIYGRWRELVVRFEVSGVQVHDTRLVASMLSHDISKILTFDIQDFARFSVLGIETIDPGRL